MNVFQIESLLSVLNGIQGALLGCLCLGIIALVGVWALVVTGNQAAKRLESIRYTLDVRIEDVCGALREKNEKSKEK